MKTNLFHFPILLSFLLVACGIPPSANTIELNVDSRQDEIVGGTLASGDPAVVAIGVAGSVFCSGTLVAPRTVITAAHCIYSFGKNANYYVLFGPNAYTSSRRVRVTAQYAHPKYDGQSRDIGILRLQSAVTDITPIELNETAFTPENIGEPIRHVGFGITGAGKGDSGRKRQVTYPLSDYYPLLLISGGDGKQTCSGDSGGPAFMKMGTEKELLVGVVSFGDAQCVQFGADARIDTDIEWIRETMGTWEVPTCNTDGMCVQGCATPDQDCVCVADGTCSAECADITRDPDCPKDCAKNNVCSPVVCPKPDPDCRPVGTECEAESECQSRACIKDFQSESFYCSQACDDANSCPSGMECTPENLCQFVPLPTKELGQVCDANNFCLNKGICTGLANEATRCVLKCDSNSDCPDGSPCETGADNRKFCRSPVEEPSTVTLQPAPTSFDRATGCSSTQGSPWSLFVCLLVVARRTKRT